jgi:hypothetical protein
MFRSTFLAPTHYAGKWIIPEEDQHYDLATVNLLGLGYATAPDSAAKEAKLLEVLECFHGYLMKYLCMIVRGTIPPANSRAGRDAKELLRTLAPRGVKLTKEITDSTCKTLHLAFKQQTTEDIYDTLVFCFVKAARQYDPYYADKIRKVCEEIYELPKQFTIQQLEARVGFNCSGILRYLVRKNLLASVIGKKKVVGYCLGSKWPAPLEFFKSGPIGFVYVIQMWCSGHRVSVLSEGKSFKTIAFLIVGTRSVGHIVLPCPAFLFRAIGSTSAGVTHLFYPTLANQLDMAGLWGPSGN